MTKAKYLRFSVKFPHLTEKILVPCKSCSKPKNLIRCPFLTATKVTGDSDTLSSVSHKQGNYRGLKKPTPKGGLDMMSITYPCDIFMCQFIEGVLFLFPCHRTRNIFGAGGNVRGYPPCSLTKYLSATKHEERQVANSMYLCSQSFNLGIE